MQTKIFVPQKGRKKKEKIQILRRQEKEQKNKYKNLKIQTDKGENKVDFPFPSANIAKFQDVPVHIVLQLKLYVLSNIIS